MSRVTLSKNPIAGKCEARVSDHDSRWPHYYQCKNAVKVERDGHGYCNAHDPEKVAARAAKRDEVFQAKMRSSNLRYAVQRAEREVIVAAEKWADGKGEATLQAAVANLRALRAGERPGDAVRLAKGAPSKSPEAHP